MDLAELEQYLHQISRSVVLRGRPILEMMLGREVLGGTVRCITTRDTHDEIARLVTTLPTTYGTLEEVGRGQAISTTGKVGLVVSYRLRPHPPGEVLLTLEFYSRHFLDQERCFLLDALYLFQGRYRARIHCSPPSGKTPYIVGFPLSLISWLERSGTTAMLGYRDCYERYAQLPESSTTTRLKVVDPERVLRGISELLDIAADSEVRNYYGRLTAAGIRPVGAEVAMREDPGLLAIPRGTVGRLATSSTLQHEPNFTTDLASLEEIAQILREVSLGSGVTVSVKDKIKVIEGQLTVTFSWRMEGLGPRHILEDRRTHDLLHIHYEELGSSTIYSNIYIGYSHTGELHTAIPDNCDLDSYLRSLSHIGIVRGRAVRRQLLGKDVPPKWEGPVTVDCWRGGPSADRLGDWISGSEVGLGHLSPGGGSTLEIDGQEVPVTLYEVRLVGYSPVVATLRVYDGPRPEYETCVLNDAHFLYRGNMWAVIAVEGPGVGPELHTVAFDVGVIRYLEGYSSPGTGGIEEGSNHAPGRRQTTIVGSPSCVTGHFERQDSWRHRSLKVVRPDEVERELSYLTNSYYWGTTGLFFHRLVTVGVRPDIDSTWVLESDPGSRLGAPEVPVNLRAGEIGNIPRVLQEVAVVSEVLLVGIRERPNQRADLLPSIVFDVVPREYGVYLVERNTNPILPVSGRVVVPQWPLVPWEVVVTPE